MNVEEEQDKAPTPPNRTGRSRLAARPSTINKIKMETIGTDTQALLCGQDRLDYDQFCQVVTTSPRILALLFANRVISTPDMDSLAVSLMKVAKEINSSTILFENLLRLEFDKASKSKTTTILRGNTLTTKCLDQFIQNYGTNYLKSVLESPLAKLLSNEAIDLEVDPSKIKFSTDDKIVIQAVLDHMDNLREYTDLFLNAILSPSTVQNFPFEAKFVGRVISLLAELYSWEPLPLIGSFVVLRFFNPSIVFPETRNLIPTSVKISATHRRNLILISKIIQNLANGIQFGLKEDYMGPMNEYINENQSKVNEFLNDICLSKEEYEQQRMKTQEEILDSVRTRKVISSSQDLLNEAMNIQLLIEKNAEKIKENLDETSPIEASELDNLLKRLPQINTDVTATAEAPIVVPPVVGTASIAPVDDKAYLKLLEKARMESFQDLEAMQLLTLRGQDAEGRPIVILTEERIRKEDLERVILYIVLKLDKVVEQDYVMVWCVNNSSDQQRPGFSWLLNVYRSLARKYKKNLKKFYLVHPTFMFKLIIKCFRPFVSEKFWKKLVMADRVHDIYKDIDKKKVPLPPSILAYDFLLRGNEPTIQPPAFGESLEKVMKRPDHAGHVIPIILEESYAYLLQGNLDTQGIFRISGAISEVQKLKILYNNGDSVDLSFCDVHTVSSLIKLFFREMPEPLFMYELYDSFIGLFGQAGNSVDSDMGPNTITNHSYVEPIQRLLKKLPKINYQVTEATFNVLHMAQKYSDVNMMTCRNLAIVFGPNILRNRNDTPLAALKDNAFITRVVELMIMEYEAIFKK